MTKEEYLNALKTVYAIYKNGELDFTDNVGKDGCYTQKEIDQAHRLLLAMINSAKKQIRKTN